MNHRQYLDMLLTARMQARIALALYQSRAALHSVAAESNGQAYWFEVDHVRAGAIVFADHMHITVCGSNDERDWRKNLQASQMRDMLGGIHSGFGDIANWLYPEFEHRRILDAAHRLPLYLGGHSAGGSIAQLPSTRQALEPRAVFTFGAPRVFSVDGAKWYRMNPWKTHRFVCSGDPVPHLPLRRFRYLFDGARYQHTPAALYLGDDGEVLMEQDSSKIRKVASLAASACMAGVAKIAETVGLMPSLIRSNHSMERYAAAIDKAIERVSE